MLPLLLLPLFFLKKKIQTPSDWELHKTLPSKRNETLQRLPVNVIIFYGTNMCT